MFFSPKKRQKKEKGQESLPFELLIAVILMTFVFLIGGQALQKANQERCFEELNSRVNEFKFNLETAINNPPGTIREFPFYLETCPGRGKIYVKFTQLTSPSACSALCGGERESCFILEQGFKEFVRGTTDIQLITNIFSCVDVPSNFQRPATGCDPIDTVWTELDLAGNAISPQNEIPFNVRYKFIKKASSTNPEICVYYKTIR